MAKIAFEDEEPTTVFEEGDEAEDGVVKKASRKSQEPQTKFQKIAYNQYFEMTTMSVIVANAIWIGVDTEWNHESLKVLHDGKAPLDPAATIIENLFCVYFTVEVVIRYFAFEPRRQCLYDAWFVFDSILVACMILETWLMPIIEAIAGGELASVGPLAALRLLRLLRLARMGRLVRSVPEMAKLVKGMVKASRSVIFIIIFLVLVMYVFSIIFTGSLSDREQYPLTPYCSQEVAQGLNESDGCLADHEFGELAQDLFSTMGDAFMSLFTLGVLGDNLAFAVQAILDQSLLLMWVWFVFLIITFATLLNMLIGVVCSVIAESAAEEEEAHAANMLRDTIEEAFDEIDEDGNGVVTSKEWMLIKDMPNVREAFGNIGVEEERMEERLEQMHDMLFMDDDPDCEGFENEDQGEEQDIKAMGLTVDQLIEKVGEIRPDQSASALDLELMQATLRKDQKLMVSKLKRMEGGVRKFIKLQAEQQAAEAAKRREQEEKNGGMIEPPTVHDN